jgi:hypothetical protein
LIVNPLLSKIAMRKIPKLASTKRPCSGEYSTYPDSPCSAAVLVARKGERRRSEHSPRRFLVSPEKDVTSPFNFQLKFLAHGGSAINADSFHLTYLRNPTVDLTARVRTYVTAGGLEMAGGQAPLGRHVIEAKISDRDGREGSVVFVLNVVK